MHLRCKMNSPFRPRSQNGLDELRPPAASPVATCVRSDPSVASDQSSAEVYLKKGRKHNQTQLDNYMYLVLELFPRHSRDAVSFDECYLSETTLTIRQRRVVVRVQHG